MLIATGHHPRVSTIKDTVDGGLGLLHRIDATDLQERLVRIMEDDRRWIVRDLQDGLLQVLSNTSMRLDLVMRWMDVAPERVNDEILRVYRRLGQAILDVRQFVDDLQPVSVDAFGLGPAVMAMARRLEQEWGVPITVVDDATALAGCLPTTTLMLYRAIQEAVTNAAKHAHADRVVVRLYQDSPHLGVDVVDDGIGFDPHHVGPGHYGLRIMEDRAGVLGGTCQVESEAGHGTTIRLRVPVAPVPPGTAEAMAWGNSPTPS